MEETPDVEGTGLPGIVLAPPYIAVMQKGYIQHPDQLVLGYPQPPLYRPQFGEGYFGGREFDIASKGTIAAPCCSSGHEARGGFHSFNHTIDI